MTPCFNDQPPRPGSSLHQRLEHASAGSQALVVAGTGHPEESRSAAEGTGTSACEDVHSMIHDGHNLEVSEVMVVPSGKQPHNYGLNHHV